MSEMSMVEGVARAIYEVPGRGYEWSNAEEPERKHALKYARAAIEAMRVPSPPMDAAGQSRIGRNAYVSMIDAALSEVEG